METFPAFASLHAFVLLTRGDKGVDYENILRNSGTASIKYRPVFGHDAFLVIRHGQNRAEAALVAELELQYLFGGSFWVLLCPTCNDPLTLASPDYACKKHGKVTMTDGMVSTELLPSQPFKKRSRHGSRSSHKQEALGASWARFVADAPMPFLPSLAFVSGEILEESDPKGESIKGEGMETIRLELRTFLEENLELAS